MVDDDERLRQLLAEYLSGRGFRVDTADDGAKALSRARARGIDLVVLDLTLPGRDGLDVLRELRTFSPVPVIVLTARGDETDRIVGLELGADDYVPKPFNPRELVARIHAVLRRVEESPKSASEELHAGPVAIDAERREARLNGSLLELTTTEFEILRALVANAGRVLPRERVMQIARGDDFASFERSVDVHVSHLRKKLGDDPRSPALIKTVRGVGYTMPKDRP